MEALPREIVRVLRVFEAVFGVLGAGRFSTHQVEALLPQHRLPQVAQLFDPVHGGIGSAPKFPQTPLLQYLLTLATCGDGSARTMLATTLHHMAAGGMYDHVSGGFARYSTDERWHVPHFEKMLYDNAQLARAYTVFARDGELVPLTLVKTGTAVSGEKVLSAETARADFGGPLANTLSARSLLHEARCSEACRVTLTITPRGDWASDVAYPIRYDVGADGQPRARFVSGEPVVIRLRLVGEREVPPPLPEFGDDKP